MILRLIAPPTQEPVTVEAVKTYLRVDNEEENGTLENLVKAAREAVEQYTLRAFLRQTWELILERPSRYIYLPRPPIIEIEEVVAGGKPLEPGQYELLAKELLVLKAVPGNELRVRYVAGYGDDPNEVPVAIRQAIMMLVGHMYENREGQPTEIKYQAQFTGALPTFVHKLAHPYRVMML